MLIIQYSEKGTFYLSYYWGRTGWSGICILFVRMIFQYGLSSGLVGGVGRDAAFVVNHLRKTKQSAFNSSQNLCNYSYKVFDFIIMNYYKIKARTHKIE